MKIPVFQKKLMAWYRKNARDLPWRRTSDPYKIWISEIMLQQTQVVTVIDYYRRWIKRFPDIRSLAKARLSDVLHAWAGLGYYRRARMIHEAAKIVMREYGGKLPGSAGELLKLPGIGRYTAGAIASIAFGEKTPVLDGNVIRILTRIFAVRASIQNTRTIAGLWDRAGRLIPEKNPGDFNQAMMELGATVCLPDNPECGQCPVSGLCKAHEEKKETDYPVRGKREKTEKLRRVALVLKHQGKVLLVKQPREGRWGGLWTFPTWNSKKEMLKELKIKPQKLKYLTTIHHSFTKYRIRLDAHSASCEDRRIKIFSPARKVGWISRKKLPHFPMPAPYQKLFLNTF